MTISILWLLIVLILSVIPAHGPKTNLPIDKIVHFILYGITTIVLLRVLRLKTTLTKSVILSILIASLYGFAMEIVQAALPWREFSIADEIANISGAVFFGVLYGMKNCRARK